MYVLSLKKKIRLKAESNSPRKIYRMLNMAQRPRCLSDSFAGKDAVDSSSLYLFGPDRPPPTKRVRRLLHDPTRVQPMESVFCEYDWRTDKFASTLRVGSDVPSSSSSSPPRRSKSAFLHSRNTVEPSSPGDIIPVRNTAISRVHPSALQRVPDAARLSSYLLTAEETVGMVNGGPPAFYPTSPISRDESSLSSSQWSPLQQFIASYGETPENDIALSRIPKRRRDGMRARTPRGSRRASGLDSSVGSDRTIVTGRRRSNTWDSDVTALDPVDDVSSLGRKQGKSVLEPSPTVDPPYAISSIQLPCTPSTEFIDDMVSVELRMDVEDDAEMSDATRSAAQHSLLHAPDLWTVWEGEERTPTPSLAGPSRTKRKQHTMLSPNLNSFSRNEIEQTQGYSGFDASPSTLLEDDQEVLATMSNMNTMQKKSPIATFASAVHLRYVSLCLQIQLDTFRMEKKVKRKLRDPWMKSSPAECVLSPRRA